MLRSRFAERIAGASVPLSARSEAGSRGAGRGKIFLLRTEACEKRGLVGGYVGFEEAGGRNGAGKAFGKPSWSASWEGGLFALPGKPGRKRKRLEALVKITEKEKKGNRRRGTGGGFLVGDPSRAGRAYLSAGTMISRSLRGKVAQGWMPPNFRSARRRPSMALGT